jgi:hypothetical protein
MLSWNFFRIHYLERHIPHFVMLSFVQMVHLRVSLLYS